MFILSVLSFITACSSENNYSYNSDREILEFTLLSNDTYEVTQGEAYSNTDIVIPREYNGKKVTSIGEAAFSSCSTLERITIPNSVTNIVDYAFSKCSSLKSITIPSSVSSIGKIIYEII